MVPPQTQKVVSVKWAQSKLSEDSSINSQTALFTLVKCEGLFWHVFIPYIVHIHCGGRIRNSWVLSDRFQTSANIFTKVPFHTCMSFVTDRQHLTQVSHHLELNWLWTWRKLCTACFPNHTLPAVYSLTPLLIITVLTCSSIFPSSLQWLSILWKLLCSSRWFFPVLHENSYTGKSWNKILIYDLFLKVPKTIGASSLTTKSEDGWIAIRKQYIGGQCHLSLI